MWLTFTPRRASRVSESWARWLLLGWFYADLVGDWYYATRPHKHVRFKDINFALMSFKLDLEGNLSYEVDLYETLEDLRSRTGQRRGHAKSLAVTYAVEQKCVELVFRVEYFTGRPEDVTRKGRLSLHFSSRGLLEGDYISEVWEGDGNERGRAISSGRMIAAPTIYELEKAIARVDGAHVEGQGRNSIANEETRPPAET